jgi:DedD protein
MMEEKQELNDIILNKGNSASNNKKIILAVATLGIVLIIVVLLMNSISSDENNNLPQAVLPPDPREINQQPIENEPLFEDVEVVQESTANDNLDNIAQRLKEQSAKEKVKPAPKPKPKPVVKPKPKPKPVVRHTEKKVVKTTPKKTTTKKMYYAQVGSFSKYEPNKKFLKSITDKGYGYTYKKVGKLNKVLVGPFKDDKEARRALKVIRSSIEAGAFLVKY